MYSCFQTPFPTPWSTEQQRCHWHGVWRLGSNLCVWEPEVCVQTWKPSEVLPLDRVGWASQ